MKARATAKSKRVETMTGKSSAVQASACRRSLHWASGTAMEQVKRVQRTAVDHGHGCVHQPLKPLPVPSTTLAMQVIAM